MTDNWTIMTPYAKFRFAAPRRDRLHAFEELLEKVPGVKQKKGFWNVPYNAISVVDSLRITHGISVPTVFWGRPRQEPWSWDDIEAELREKGEVRDWVLDGFLMPHQKDAIEFGWTMPGVHFWHSTGAGKTISSLITALSVPGPVIVVTRASAKIQHSREIERFLNVRAYIIRPKSKIKKLMTVDGMTWQEFFSEKMPELGKAAEVAALWQKAKKSHGVKVTRVGQTLDQYLAHCASIGMRPFILIGWEAVKDYYVQLINIAPGVVIYDELHWRGRNAKRWDPIALPDLPENRVQAQIQIDKETAEARSQDGFIKATETGRIMFLPVLNIASAAARLSRTVPKRIGTTATPISNLVRDLWSQLDIVEPNCWGNKTLWMARHCDAKPGTYGGMDTTGASRLDELNERLKKIAHIVPYKDTHAHLPPKRRQSVYIAPEDQCKASVGFRAELKAAKARGATAVLETRLALAASKKRKAVLGMIGDHVGSKQKVVVFTARRRDCDELGLEVRKHLKKIGCADTTVWSAHGDASTDLRQEIVDEFMAHPGPCVLVGTGHSFGESLNIDSADAVFFVMLPYTPGMLRQWEGRFHRASTTKPVIIYYVIAEDTIDEHVAQILINKLPEVAEVAKDTELAEAEDVLAGLDSESDQDFADAILASLDF